MNLNRLKQLAGLINESFDDEDPDVKIASSDKRQQEFEKKNKGELKKAEKTAGNADKKAEAKAVKKTAGEDDGNQAPKAAEKKPAAKPAPKAAEKKPAAKPAAGNAGGNNSKSGQARQWLASHTGATRGQFIQYATGSLGMSKAHANTFFYAAKKRVNEFYVIKNKQGQVLSAFSAYDKPQWVAFESSNDHDAMTVLTEAEATAIVAKLRKNSNYGIVAEKKSLKSIKFGNKMAKTSKAFKKTRTNMKTLKESDYGAPKSSPNSGTDTGASPFKGEAPDAKEINYGDTKHKDAKKIDFGKTNKDGEFTKEKENDGDSIEQTTSMFSGKGKSTAGTKPASKGGVASTPDNKSEKTDSKPVWDKKEGGEKPVTDVAKSHEDEEGKENKVEVPSSVKNSLNGKKEEMRQEAEKHKGRNPDGNAFYETVVDAMSRLEKMIDGATVKEFKEAQLFMSGLMGPILWLIPEDVRHFVTTGGRKQSLMDMYKEVKLNSTFGGK